MKLRAQKQDADATFPWFFTFWLKGRKKEYTWNHEWPVWVQHWWNKVNAPHEYCKVKKVNRS